LGALAVIWAPVRTLARAAEERWVLLAFGIVALYAALNLVGTGLGAFSALEQLRSGPQGAELPPEFEEFFPAFFVFGLVFSVVWPFVSWLLISGLMQLITRFFGGTGPFSGMLAVIGVAHVPYLIERLIQLPLAGLQILLVPDPATAADPTTGGGLAATLLGLLGFLLWLAALVWFVILVVIGAAFARRVGYGESAGSCAISCAGIVGLILIVGVVLAVVVAALVGAVSAAGPS
jgi:hypothetical protein